VSFLERCRFGGKAIEKKKESPEQEKRGPSRQRRKLEAVDWSVEATSNSPIKGGDTLEREGEERERGKRERSDLKKTPTREKNSRAEEGRRSLGIRRMGRGVWGKDSRITKREKPKKLQSRGEGCRRGAHKPRPTGFGISKTAAKKDQEKVCTKGFLYS